MFTKMGWARLLLFKKSDLLHAKFLVEATQKHLVTIKVPLVQNPLCCDPNFYLCLATASALISLSNSDNIIDINVTSKRIQQTAQLFYQ